MSEIEESTRNPLLPVRHTQPDFFVCDIFDATPKGDQASMEHPLFTLSTKPDLQPREYRQGSTFVKLTPSTIGLATVHDRDVIIYALSQCMARLQRGLRVERKMRFHPHDLMVMTNRETNGGSYKRFKDTLMRLRSTTIETNIKMGGVEVTRGFGFISSFEIVRETREGRMLEVEIELSDWLFNAIEAKGNDLLTISPAYFRLRKPLERRLYELARKHCGRQARWHIGLDKLHQKTGASSKLKEFRRMVSAIVKADEEHGHFPDYTVRLDGDLVVFRPRADFLEAYASSSQSAQGEPTESRIPPLPAGAIDAARDHAAGYDLYQLEVEWRAMLTAKGSTPENLVGSFIGYVKWYVKQNGAAR
ncbi:plasmid replication initiator protein-like protein [Stappia sp. 22II-S9-Z10]|nr:plasmid replication initiator protein-like protein [Stappia sp. 22II-S9-Z10]